MISNKLHILKVFVDRQRNHGNPVGIMLDLENKLKDQDRLNITKETGFSECVFIEDLSKASIKIYNPQLEVDFAGHALVGTSYFLNNILSQDTTSLLTRKTSVNTWSENGKVLIASNSSSLPPWNLVELDSSNSVENIPIHKHKTFEHTYLWAWLNKSKSIIRARTFAPDWGIIEDEANGSGTMKLAAQLKQSITVVHGKNSRISTEYISSDQVHLGGEVKYDKWLEFK